MGTVVPVGLPSKGQINADLFDIIARMVKIKGSWVGNEADLKEALEIFQTKGLKVPHRIMGLQDLPLAFDMLEKGESCTSVLPKFSF